MSHPLAMVWVNDRLMRAGELGIDPRDRGFTLGDGLFETIRVEAGVPVRLASHLHRMRQGAATIGMRLDWTDAALAEMIERTRVANGLREAVVRLTVSRGVPVTRGLIPDSESLPSLVIHAQPFTGYPAALYERGMQVITSRIRRNEYSPVSNLKSLNYLDNILARQEATAQQMDEALMLNTVGQLACASVANLFIVRDGMLLTPPLSAGVLPGTVRSLLLTQAATWLKCPVLEQTILPGDLQRADEAFLTNALMGVMPLTTVDDHPIGSGVPGPLTEKLRQMLVRLEPGNDAKG